jgi:hypothetical protein
MWFFLSHPDYQGAVYHPSWPGILFGNGQNFITWHDTQPAMVLHELSHAWDHQQYDFDHPDVTAAYDAAMEAGLYDGQYASINAIEYFGELTEAYFWENDGYPHVNSELASYDPQGYAAVESAWGL